MDTPTPPEFAEIDDVGSTTKEYIQDRYLGRVVALIILTAVAEAIIVYLYFLYSIGDLRLMILPLILPLAVYASIRRKIEQEFLKQFAEENGYSYEEKGSMDSVQSDYLRELGHGQSIEDVVSGTYDAFPLRLYTFSTTIHHGKSSETKEYTVFETQYAGDVMDIILDSHIHPFSFGSLISPFKNKKKLSLEGDFNKYFTVYIPDNYEMETLEVLTPDVMEELIRTASLYSFEFNDNKLFIIAGKLITTRAELNAMYEFSKILTHQLAPVLSNIKAG